MNKSSRIFQLLRENQLIALLAPQSVEQCIRAYELCRDQGVILEIAFRSPPAVEGLKAVLIHDPKALVLAGTVMTEEQAESAIQAGAAGIVSADYIPEVVDLCVRNDVMCIPGGLSDAGKQLVRKAQGYGFSLEELREKFPYQWIYKLFPAFTGGRSNMDLVKAWRGPYKDIQIVYTAGIKLDTLERAVCSDPQGIFCGSALVKNIDDAERTINEIRSWKKVLSPPLTSEPVKAKSAVLPVDPLFKTVCFGEMMARLSPPHGVRLRRAGTLDVNFGGAEANVAVSLANFGLSSFYVTALPNNELGKNAESVLRSYGVDIRYITRKGDRLGLYFLEHGAGPRPSRVIYDRAHSPTSLIGPGDLDWGVILEGAQWFHWTGITPALGDSVTASLKEALQVARRNGIPVSTDLNFRKKLWSREKAEAVMEELLPFVDVCIANEEDPTSYFGIKAKNTDIQSGKLDPEGYMELAQGLIDRFGFKKVAITLRESLSASENDWSACLYDGRDFLVSPKYRVWIVDRVGTGDAFASGLIYGFLMKKSDQDSLNFGVAAACLKHSIHGDFNQVDVDEVESLAAGNRSGRVER